MDWTREQRDAIASRGKSIAVSAAAGSGKTAVLTHRIIERVCAPDGSGDVSRILAVTFTKAAAAEIISRVSKALSEQLAKDPQNKHIARQSLLVSSAKISTVHRFCLDIIHEYFSELSLPSDFTVADSASLEVISKRILEQLIDDYFEGDVSGDEAINDFPGFADTFGSFAGTDSLVQTTLEIYAKLSNRALFIDSLDDKIQLYNNLDSSNFLDSCWGNLLLSKLGALLSHYKKIFDDALTLAGVNEIYASAIPVFEYELETVRSLLYMIDGKSDYSSISDALSEYSPKTLRFSRKAVLCPDMEYFKEARNSFKKELRSFRDTYFVFSENEITQAARETASQLKNLKIFLNAFDKRFKAEKMRRKTVSFSDMEHLALEILWDKENDRPSEAAMKVRDSFDEIYIDEYQDTNEVQDKIFSLISKENNKFCVGDVKQSIYGFRGAEPEIFTKMLDGREKYTDELTSNEAKIFLSKNFRSSIEILDFCNSVFEKLMNAGEKKSYGADERLYSGSGRSCSKVEIKMTEDSESEAEYVAARISRLRAEGTKLSDIAIILRSGTSVDIFERALDKRGIPCRNSIDSDFFVNSEILLVLSLLNVIDNPERDVYLAATLKSPLYCVSLDELMHIRRNYEGSLYEALVSFTNETGFKNGKRFLDDLSRFREMAKRLPCDKLIWNVYMETGIFSIVCRDENDEIYSAEQAKTNLIQLYNYSRGFETGTYRGLYDFISFINNVIEGNTKIDLSQFGKASDSVNIMTIHKSKGLEFPVCFLCGTSRSFNVSDTRGNVIFNDKTGPVPKLVHSSKMGKVKTPYWNISRIPVNSSTIDEEMRVLYVALTRPKDKLIITAAGESLEKTSLEHYLLEQKYFSEYSVSKFKSYFDMIMSSVAGSDKYVYAENEDGAAIIEEKKGGNDKGIGIFEARKIINERFSYVYPYEGLSRVPSKVAVSNLYPDLLDEGETQIESSELTYTPRFLSAEDEEFTAAERGIATHTFMQFFDFERVKNHGVKGEIEYLAEHKFIFDADVPKINVYKLDKFFGSELARRMRESKRVIREKRFMLSFPASDFTEDEVLRERLVDESLLVQGVIDCVFEDDDGKYVLVDYKTDSFPRTVPREEIIKTMKQRHSRQLGYYKRACERLFGEISRIYIYSFALDDVIEL